MDSSHVINSKRRLTAHRRHEHHILQTRTRALNARDPKPEPQLWPVPILSDLPLIGPLFGGGGNNGGGGGNNGGGSGGGNNGGGTGGGGTGGGDSGGGSGGGDTGGGSGGGGSGGGGSGGGDSGSGGGGSDSGGGSSGGGSSGGNTSPPPSPPPSNGGGSTGGDTSGGSGSGGSGSGSQGGNGGQTPNPPSSGNGNGNGNGNGDANQGESGTGANTSTGSSAAPTGVPSGDSSSGNSSSPPSSTAGPGPQGVVNAAPGDGNGSSESYSSNQQNGNEPGTSFPNGSSSPSGSPSHNSGTSGGRTNSGGGSGDPSLPPGDTNSTDSTSNDGSPSGGSKMSTGAIAGISVVVALLLIALFVFCARRMYKKRRADRKRRWTLGGTAMAHGGIGPEMGMRSARSSFATNIDAGLSPLSPSHVHDSDNGWRRSLASPPPIPPMHTGGSASPRSSVGTLSSEFSIGSQHNDASTWEKHASLFLQSVPPSASAAGNVSSPTVVRPFSPSESWSFPQPPSTHSDGGGATATSTHESPTNSAIVTMAAPRVQSIYSIASDPFADAGVLPTTAHVTLPASTFQHADLRGLETRICRPFLPTLHDELAVQRGEPVRVLTTFDDGWVIVEKTASREKGLIPVVCLQEEDSDVPAFMAAKRGSSNSAGNMFAAL